MWCNHGNNILSPLPYSMDRSKLQVLPSLRGGALHRPMIHWGSSRRYAYPSSFNMTFFRSYLLFPATELLSKYHVPSGTFPSQNSSHSTVMVYSPLDVKPFQSEIYLAHRGIHSILLSAWHLSACDKQEQLLLKQHFFRNVSVCQ